jgi:hypothetical protein
MIHGPYKVKFTMYINCKILFKNFYDNVAIAVIFTLGNACN